MSFCVFAFFLFAGFIWPFAFPTHGIITTHTDRRIPPKLSPTWALTCISHHLTFRPYRILIHIQTFVLRLLCILALPASFFRPTLSLLISLSEYYPDIHIVPVTPSLDYSKA